VDELGWVGESHSGGNAGEEGFALDLAMAAETGGDAVEVGVAVAGVADEFPDVVGVGEGFQDFGQRRLGEVAGGGDAEAASGGEDCSRGDLGLMLEGAFEAAEEVDLQATDAGAMVEGEAPGALEGVADGGDVEALGDAEEWAGDLREKVGVLVGVEVGDADAGGEELLDLGFGFAFDVLFLDAAEDEGAEEVDQTWAEVGGAGGEEGGDGFGGRDGEAVGEDDVAADAKSGVRLGEGDGIVEGGAAGHEGGGGEDVGLMELEDGAVDAGGEAEVVCVDDEACGHGFD